MTQEKNQKENKGPKRFVYFIDQEKFETDETALSVRFLLVDQAEEDPATTTLALKEGNDYKKFTNLDEMVPMKNGMKFVVFHNEPTPVSDSGNENLYGAERLRADLEKLGFTVKIAKGTDKNNYVVISNYEVQIGRFAGRIIHLGILATPDYPRSVASAIHVKANPQLLEKQNIPNVRNITDSNLGAEWRYWSKNFNWKGERTTRRLVSQINTIFKDA